MLFFLLNPVFSLDTGSCALIICENTTTPSEYCLDWNPSQNSVYLTLPKCETNCNFTSLYLPDTTWESIACYPRNVTGNPTGAPCTVASNCSSFICSDPVCFGTPNGLYCPDDEACMPGSYCDNYVCEPNLLPGDSCTRDEECPIGYGCDKGSCSIYFSKTQGESASSHLFCKSNFLFNGRCDSLKVHRLGSEIGPPFNCKVNEDCTYVSKQTGEVYATKPCTCAGVKNKGGGYCSNYLEWADDLIQDRYIYMTYTYSTCGGNFTHTDNPDTLFMCGSISQDQYDFFFNLLGRARHWALYQSHAIDDCSEYFGLFNTTYDLNFYSNAVYTAAYSLLLYLVN